MLVAIAALGCPVVLLLGLLVVFLAGGVLTYLGVRGDVEEREATAVHATDPVEEIPVPQVAPPDAGAGDEPPQSEAVATTPVKKSAGKPGMGELDQAVIKKVINGNLGRFKYCYERELGPSPSLKGKVVVKFTISPSGTVSKASIASSSLGSKNVEGCVLKVAKKLRFPKPKGGSVVVSYPFMFAPAG